MSVRDQLARANRLQQGTPFKVAASIAVVAVAIVAFVVYLVSATAPGADQTTPQAPPPQPAAAAPAPDGAASAAEQAAREAVRRIQAEFLARATDPRGVAAMLGAGAGVALAIIWLGLGLTFLGLILVAAVVIAPMELLSRTDWAASIFLDPERRSPLASALRSTARLLSGLVVLTAAFTALMRGLQSVLTMAHPVIAIARTALAEAVRMKVSLIFMILLVFFLAWLPYSLKEADPLRYRVQRFLEYGTSVSFWLIAILTLLFGVATVAFEQRDRQIWQTMTKPVAPWQYLLGKWLGVAGLAGVLLAVCCSAVFLFTEHLRGQPAHGETRPGVAAGGISQDRLVLETQVLAARIAVNPTPAFQRDSAEFLGWVRNKIEDERKRDPSFAVDDAMYNRVVGDLYKQVIGESRSVAPGQFKEFVFEGLGPALRNNRPLVLRFKIDSGSNLPSVTYRISFMFPELPPEVREVGLGTTHTLEIRPDIIDPDGTLHMRVVNGDFYAGTPNPAGFGFPPGGLELSYSVAGYRLNFVRGALILWVKLAFLAMLAIWAATFLSFPVACLVAFSAFLGAEGANFLRESLEYYPTTTDKGETVWARQVIASIGAVVAGMFRYYAELKPTTRLVDGRLIGWGSVLGAVGVLGVWSALLYGTAVVIFRRRELATYSGQ